MLQHCCFLLGILFVTKTFCLIPPKFQWKSLDFAWPDNSQRAEAIKNHDYNPENNLPTGLARWKDKLFITIPRWKSGVPSSLNYVYLNGTQDQPLNPYPSWESAFIRHNVSCVCSNDTVVSTFRAAVDKCDRLWVVDNGLTDMLGKIKQIAKLAILIFDLKTDTLLHKYELSDDVIRSASVITSIVLDIDPKSKNCSDTFVYLTDMGSSAIIVYNHTTDTAWRLQNPYFHFDPHAGSFNVGGVKFYQSEGVSNAALSQKHSDGSRDLYFHPTSSTKLFRISTKILKNKDASPEDILNDVLIVGDRGPMSQVTACDFDPRNNVLFYTQVNKNGVACWNPDTSYENRNNPIIFRDCSLLEYPSDVKVDLEGDIWILSNRQARFIYDEMDFKKRNFRIMTTPVKTFVKGTACEKKSKLSKVFSFCKKLKSSDSRKSCCSQNCM